MSKGHPPPPFFPRRAAVFLDRDGTLIPDHGYLDNVAGVVLLPGVATALRQLVDAGFALILVTNQSGIGRGYFTAELVASQHQRLRELLRPHGVELAAIEFCPHQDADGCHCRKPQPGMLLRAAQALGLDLTRSFMVGDSLRDAAAGRAAGCRTLLLAAPSQPNGDIDFVDIIVPDLTVAAAWIVAHQQPQALG